MLTYSNTSKIKVFWNARRKWYQSLCYKPQVFQGILYARASNTTKVAHVFRRKGLLLADGKISKSSYNHNLTHCWICHISEVTSNSLHLLNLLAL